MKNQNMNNINSFFTIMAISKAKLMNNQYSCIASSYYLLHPAPFSLNSNSMIDRFNTFYNNEKLTIIIVSDKTDTIKIINIGDSINSNYTIFQIPPIEFFENTFIEKILLNNNMNKTIFMFYNIKYRSIIDNLALLNIKINGGSGSKKHILSPVQLRLARFVIAISNNTGDEIVDSFYFEKSKDIINITNKEAKFAINEVTDNLRNDIIFGNKKSK